CGVARRTDRVQADSGARAARIRSWADSFRFDRPSNTVIGIRNTQLGQYRSLQDLHFSSSSFALVFPAEQVENAVHDEVAEMVDERLALIDRLALDRLER